MVGDELHAHGLDAGDFACKVYARQPVSRDAEMHHAARQRSRLVDLDRVTETCEMICRRQAAGTGTHDEHAFAGRRGLDLVRPVAFRGEIAQKAFDRMDADRRIQCAAVTRVFAGVVADPAMHGRQGIVAHQRFPSLAILPRLREIEPGLNVLTRRTSRIAGRQQINVNRTPHAHRPRSLVPGQIDDRRHVHRFQAHLSVLTGFQSTNGAAIPK
jgi:hypothetical protein